MFAGGFFRARLVRRIISGLAALMAFIGGVLVLVAAAASYTALDVLAILVSLGALFGAWGIYRGGRALLFPRARLSFAGFITTAAGVILFILGFGLDAILVIVGGVASWVATIL